MQLGCRRQEIDAVVQAHQDLVVAEAQPVAVLQRHRSGLRDRIVRFVDEHAVRALVAQPVGAAAILDVAVVP